MALDARGAEEVLRQAQPAAAADDDRAVAAAPESRSSLIRPSRTWTTRSAPSADAGSWLTTSAVPPLANELGDQLEHLAGGRGVELTRRLVGDQQPGPVGDRGTERDPLLLATRELARMRAAALAEPDPLEQLVGARLTPVRATPASPSCTPTSSRIVSSPASARQ